MEVGPWNPQWPRTGDQTQSPSGPSLWIHKKEHDQASEHKSFTKDTTAAVDFGLCQKKLHISEIQPKGSLQLSKSRQLKNFKHSENTSHMYFLKLSRQTTGSIVITTVFPTQKWCNQFEVSFLDKPRKVTKTAFLSQLRQRTVGWEVHLAVLTCQFPLGVGIR